MGFELRDGIFKRFVDWARKNYEEVMRTTDASGEIRIPKQYVFIIDEINRGEISKIFGRLRAHVWVENSLHLP